MSTTWGTTWSGRGIWDNGPSVSLPQSAVATREYSQSRKQSQTVMTPVEEPEAKSGSGSLVDGSSSLGGRPSFRPSFSSNWGSSGSAGRLASQNGLTSVNTSQPRSFSTNVSAQPLSAASQSFSLASRPPISLNATSTTQQRQPYGMGSTNSLSARSNEQPPTVYTKFDRPADPFTNANRKDSAFNTINTWDRRSTPTDTPRVSPLDERHPQSFGGYRTGSMSTSRDASQQPPSRHSEQQASYHGQDFSRYSSQPPTAPNTRATSFAAQGSGSMNGFSTQSLDQVGQRLGQLNLNSNSRPSTSSYKQPSASNGFGLAFGAVPPAAPALALTGSGAYSQEDVEEIDRSNLQFMGIDSFSPQHGGYSDPSRSAFGSRFGQTPGSIDLRNVPSFTPGASQARSFVPQNGPRSPEWQSFANGTSAVSRRSPSLPDPQAYLDPRIQQLLEAQLRASGYGAPMYSPYAVPNGMQPPPLPSYLPMLPMPPNGADPNAAMREVACGDGVQSALMYEFKSNTKTKRYELKDIYDHIAEFSGDQHGSRFIQTKLETANSDEKDRVFREIEPNAIPLMTDVFGNYVIQKFFEHGDQTHKKILANKMRGQVLNLSLQMYGCRVVQKALDHVLVDQQAVLIGELESHVLKCVKDQNGNHVIQKAIERCPPHTIQFIINAFRGQVLGLSIHPYGCRVIQRCLERCDMPSKAMILEELMEPNGIPSMISDQYGNYVVQHVVSKDDGRGKQKVLQIVLHGLEGFSKHKFASNVVEKCLEQADDFWRRQVVWKLDELQRLQRRVEGEGVLVSMIKDNFGNYVIQKLLDTLSQQDFWEFIDLLSPAMQQAKRTGCGKQVQSIEKKMHRYPPRPYGGNNHQQYNSYQLPLPTPVYGSHFGSAANTPPPLTADTQSLQSSAIPSINGDAVEGADRSRKSSEPGSDGRYERL